MGKTTKSYVTTPLSISFPWAREGKPLALSLNTLKYSKCVPYSSLSISPVMHLFQCTQCACGALQNCPLFCIEYMYFPIFLQISSFSSKRKVQNSTPSFQFITPGRELTQKSMKSMKFQHLQLLKETKFGPHLIYS